MEHIPQEQVMKGKELESSFTIPKKNVSHYDHEQDNPTSCGHDTVMANVYGSFVQATHNYQTGGAFGAWTDLQASNYYSDHCQYPNQFIMNSQSAALKRTREEPKTTKANVTYRESFTKVNDPSLPKELTAMFQPLYCKLCAAQLSSNTMAKMHYKSRNHDKRVRKYLIEYSERTGEPLHKRVKVTKTRSETEEYDAKHFRCDVCDLPLTGKIHAESHYMGKNHQKVVMGKKAPAGKGFYNEEGKWVRTVSAKADVTGRDGFGQDFVVAKQEVKYNAKSDNALHCDLCVVSTTSMPQMEMHLQGQRHKKKVKRQLSGLSPSVFDVEPSTVNQNGETVKGNPNDMLCSYRTPSGQYYCKSCNLSQNSEMQFMQHLNSKKHLKKGNNKE